MLSGTEQPEIADLPYEMVSVNYDGAGLLSSMDTDGDPLISDTVYDHYGRNTVLEYGAFGQHLRTTSVYDDHTGSLTDAYTDRDTAPQRIEDSHYTYDPAGNITQITTNYGQDAARTTDTQCFTLDALTRITEAWTNTGSTCATAPSTEVIGGQDPYWTSYTYDAVGNRKTETQHTTAAGPTVDTVRTYAEPTPGKHNLPGVTQTGTQPRTEAYTYTASGATETRTFKQGTTTTLDQNLVWDDEGHLKSVTSNGKTTSYTYDADGQRLTRTDSTGTTLYLPEGNELHVDKVGLPTGTRYYSAGTKTVAMRTGAKLTFLLTDHHGTTTTQVTADATQSITRRKTGIFGAPRGSQSTPWVGDKGFVGGTKDADTGLTHLGAREYDPAIGRFISVDPVMVLQDPQQVHGYTYGNNNPVTLSDPSGLWFGVPPGLFKPSEPNTSTGDGGTANTSNDNSAAADYRCGFPGCSSQGYTEYGPNVDEYTNNAVRNSDRILDGFDWIAKKLGLESEWEECDHGSAFVACSVFALAVVAKVKSGDYGESSSNGDSSTKRTSTKKKGAEKKKRDDDDQPVYRGDARSPEEIMAEGGFQPNAPDADTSLYDFVTATRNHSRFVSTSRHNFVAANFPGGGGGGYVYEIRGAPNGIDVNATLGGMSPNPHEAEIAFDGGIPWDYVTRVWKKDEWGEVDFDYDDPIWER